MAVKEEKKILGMDREKYRMFMGKYGIGIVLLLICLLYTSRQKQGGLGCSGCPASGTGPSDGDSGQK